MAPGRDAMTDVQVIVIGSYNRDHVWRVDRFPQPGETRIGRDFTTGPGGKGFNQAIACHRLGAKTLFLAAIGDDGNGAQAQRDAEADGLPCRWKSCADAPTAATAVWVDDAGQNEIIVHAGANARLDPAFLDGQRDVFAGARVLLVQMETQLATVRRALELAHAGGAMRFLNPAPVHADTDASLLALCDVLTPNETEFAALCAKIAGAQVDPDKLASLSDAELHALARKLPAPTLVITLGARGCFVSHADTGRLQDRHPCYRVPAERAQAIDTTGAGDCFCGALAAAVLRLEGQPFVRAVRFANRAAALSTERPGAAAAMPRYDEVIAHYGG